MSDEYPRIVWATVNDTGERKRFSQLSKDGALYRTNGESRNPWACTDITPEPGLWDNLPSVEWDENGYMPELPG